MSNLNTMRQEFEAKQKALADIFSQAGKEMDMDKVTAISGDSKSKVSQIQQKNAELSDLGKNIDALVDAEKAYNENEKRREAIEAGKKTIVHPGSSSQKPEVKSLGQQFIESKAYAHRDTEAMIDVELKTLFERTAGWAPESLRTGAVVDYATRPVQIMDLIPMDSTTQSAIKYMEETTFTNNAVEKAEGTEYAEAALALTERSVPVEKLPVFIPVTDEQLEDVAGIQSYLERRLRFMISQKLDSQIMQGSGTPPQIQGILNKAGIQTQAKGTDVVPDAIYKAMTKIRTIGFAIPNALAINPLDWQDIKLIRTADGIYIWGNPSENGPDRIWGINVVISTVMTENTALVGDYANFVRLVTKRGITVKVSDSHSDYFIKGKQAVRADMRCALVIERPAAFCTVTGI